MPTNLTQNGIVYTLYKPEMQPSSLPERQRERIEILGYIYADPKNGTVPLIRSMYIIAPDNSKRDFVYTTDVFRGMHMYSILSGRREYRWFDGIVGYILPSPVDSSRSVYDRMSVFEPLSSSKLELLNF